MKEHDKFCRSEGAPWFTEVNDCQSPECDCSCNCEGLALIRADEREKIGDRIRQVHAKVTITNQSRGYWWASGMPDGKSEDFCLGCMANSAAEYGTPWPCPTIEALAGGQ